jgi:hypothetical protein
MRPGVLLGLTFLTIFLQEKPRAQVAPQTAVCGLGGSPECRCLLRTQLLQDEHLNACAQKYDRLDRTQKQQWLDCVKRQPLHCDIVANTALYGHPWIENSKSHIWMDARCSVMCKKHNCKCDDGPICRDVP